MILLKLKQIKKYFPIKKGLLAQGSEQFVRAVDGVDLNITVGENVCLIGESGCGKTTLARIILKLMTANEGNIFFEGREVSGLRSKDLKEYRRCVQIVFQDPYSSLDPRYTVRSILQEAFTLDNVKFQSRKSQEERIREVLDSVLLTDEMLNRYPHEFSGGERQRIAIARALMLNPKLIVLDEAVSSLDVIIQKQIIDLLLNLQQRFGLTYLFISHNLKVARKMSRKTAVMYRGKIVEFAETEEIFQNPLHLYTKNLLSAALEYRVAQDEDVNIPADVQWMEKTKGHFVLV